MLFSGVRLKRACALWHAKFTLGPLAIKSADIASWTVTMGGPNWQVITQIRFRPPRKYYQCQLCRTYHPANFPWRSMDAG